MNTIILENAQEASFNEVPIGDWIVLDAKLHVKITDDSIFDILGRTSKTINITDRVKVLKAVSVRVP